MTDSPARRLLIVASYFDGTSLRNEGPYTLCFDGGRVTAVLEGEHDSVRTGLPTAFREASVACDRAAFAMPGMVEAHAHLFLNGSELDVKVRSAYLKKATRNEMLAVARDSVDRSIRAGVTLIRDAGDRIGANHTIRDALVEEEGVRPEVLSAGVALRKPKRYGSFMAREVDTPDEISSAVEELAACSDQIKVLMTGIIDFESGQVKGKPQFTVDEARWIVEVARSRGLKTFAHCSGLKGIRVAVEAGIDSIEHAFFVDRPTLEEMAEKQIAWVPTFSPVHIQWAEPEHIGWSEDSVGHLGRILEAHREHLRYAHTIGVPIFVGTDAGSYGVDHGSAMADEIKLMSEAGLPVTELLTAATSRPRRLWEIDSGEITSGANVNVITLSASPYDSLEALKQVESIYKDGDVLNIQPLETAEA